MADLRSINRPNLSGIAYDIQSVTPDNDDDNTGATRIGLYITQAGNVAIRTRADNATKIISVPNNFDLAVQVTRVLATGTTARGIFAYQA